MEKALAGAHPQPAPAVLDDGHAVAPLQRCARLQAAETVHGQVGDEQRPLVGEEIKRMGGVLVHFPHLLLPEEALGKDVRPELMRRGVPQTQAVLGTYPPLSGGVETDFIDVAVRQGRIGVGVTGRHAPVLVAEHTHRGAYPQCVLPVLLQAEDVPLIERLLAGEVVQRQCQRIQYIQTAAVSPDPVFPLEPPDAEHHVRTHPGRAEDLEKTLVLVDIVQAVARAYQLLAAVDGKRAHGDVFRVEIRRIGIDLERIALIERVVQPRLVEAHPDNALTVHQQGVDGIGTEAAFAAGLVAHDKGFFLPLRIYEMHSVAVRTHVEHTPAVGGQGRDDITAYVDKRIESFLTDVETDDTPIHRSQIKLVTDARQLIKGAVMLAAGLVVPPPHLAVRQVHGVKPVQRGHPQAPPAFAQCHGRDGIGSGEGIGIQQDVFEPSVPMYVESALATDVKRPLAVIQQGEHRTVDDIGHHLLKRVGLPVQVPQALSIAHPEVMAGRSGHHVDPLQPFVGSGQGIMFKEYTVETLHRIAGPYPDKAQRILVKCVDSQVCQAVGSRQAAQYARLPPELPDKTRHGQKQDVSDDVFHLFER